MSYSERAGNHLCLEDVGVDFRVGAQQRDTLKSALARTLSFRAKTVRTIQALQGLTLSIGAGERVGIIGHNGAGKSTLLKVMAGIYPPSHGTVSIGGHVCPLFEFATGFEMEANGWENIRTRALLLGMDPHEIEEKIEEIAAFSELGEFLDLPVRTYSTGMLLRLAFATSTAVEPQILLLDEVMAAGDAAFAARARRRMDVLMERASIVVFATHNLAALPELCGRTILLQHGRVVADGPTAGVVRRYSNSVAEQQ